MKSNIFNKLYLYYTLNSKCASESHYGTPIYFCSEKSCNKGYICSQCLTEDTTHFSQHVKYLIALDQKKNFFNFFGIENLDSILSYTHQKTKKISDTKNFYDYIKQYINDYFNDKNRNNFFKNQKTFEKYFFNEKEKEYKNNEFINKKINEFINNNDKYKIKELIEEIKPYIKEENLNNEKNILDKINNILNEELNKIIEKCANIFKQNETENNNSIYKETSSNSKNNNLNDIIEEKIDIKKDNDNDISLTLNTNNIKNNSFYEGSINNISMIKTENNIEQEEFMTKSNNNLNNSFFKKIEQENDINSINSNSNKIRPSVNKLPFNIYEFQKREKNILNNINSNILNISPKSNIAAANNFQFYSNNDIINELEIKLNQMHNKDSAINISINNFQRKNSNNINNINIKNIYKTERQIYNSNNKKYEGENKLHIKTKNNLNRLNKIREQIGNIIK